MSDYRDIVDVEDYLHDPYLDCNYVRICGGLLRLKKAYSLRNHARFDFKDFNLSAEDLAKTRCFNINNKKLDLMDSINYRRDGYIVHLQNKIRYLESLTPEQIRQLHCLELTGIRDKDRICIAIKDKLLKIMSRMNSIGAGDDCDNSVRSAETEDLAMRLKSPDEILKLLDKFEKEHLSNYDKSKKEDKCTQTDGLLCKCQTVNSERHFIRRKYYPYRNYNNHCHYIPEEKAITLYQNYDYVEYDDTDNYSLNCEAVSSGKSTNNSWNTYVLKYKSLVDDYDRRYRRRRFPRSYRYSSKRYRSCSPARIIAANYQKRSKSLPKKSFYFNNPNPKINCYRTVPDQGATVTTLYFNDSLSDTSSIRSDYYSDTSTYSGFYTQKHLKDYYEFSEDDLECEREYSTYFPQDFIRSGRRATKTVKLSSGFYK